MEHAHPHAGSTVQPDHDTVLAAFLEQGALPDIARRANMSLAALANWASEHADLLTKLHQLLTTRCKLIAAQLELAALSALATVSSAAASSPDERLRERALERQRKAASAIIRHRAWLERTPRASSKANAPPTATPSSASSSLDASMPTSLLVTSSARAPRDAKPSLAQRFAARRLPSLAAP